MILKVSRTISNQTHNTESQTTRILKTPDFPPITLKYEKGPPRTYLKNYQVPQIPHECPISPSQFPSPQHQIEDENKEPVQPLNKIPRFILNTPQKSKMQTEENTIKILIDNTLDDRPQVNTFCTCTNIS